MLKPVKQIGSANESKSLASSGADSLKGTGFSPSNNGQQDQGASAPEGVHPWESTHEIEGSLTPITPTPKKDIKRLNPIKLKQLEDRVSALEEELPDLEARILAAEQQQSIFTTAEAAQSLAAELDTLREQHATRTAEWEDLATQLEEQQTTA